jgi:hypothetical protein
MCFSLPAVNADRAIPLTGSAEGPVDAFLNVRGDG